MRILHCTNRIFSADEIKSNGTTINSGVGWVATLLGKMINVTDHKFACVSIGSVNEIQTYYDERVDCFIVPREKHVSAESIGVDLNSCKNLIQNWKPDIIHIHGTENNFGLLIARSLVNYPTVISLQGLLGPCSQWNNYFGNNSLLEIARMHRLLEFPLRRGLWAGFLRFRKMAKREHEIIAGNKFFLGRTEWDRAYIAALNPAARYFRGGELLRCAFWSNHWDLKKVIKHRIIFTNAGHPRKGIETLLESVKLLQRDYPDIQVAIAGGISKRSGYGRYIRNKINELGKAAEDLGPLNAENMASEMVKSHLFVSPSYIDNSPNAVCEAQLLGMPVISSYTGGVPSLIEDETSGLFFPPGDAPMLAARIRRIFEDDDVAVRLGVHAYEIASRRHDPDLTVSEILTAYEDVMRNAP